MDEDFVDVTVELEAIFSKHGLPSPADFTGFVVSADGKHVFHIRRMDSERVLCDGFASLVGTMRFATDRLFISDEELASGQVRLELRVN